MNPDHACFGGHAGGWPAGFAELVEDVRGIEFAPIDFEIADDLGHWRVEVPGKARGSAEALTGPTAPEGARVQLHNAPGAEDPPDDIGALVPVPSGTSVGCTSLSNSTVGVGKVVLH